MEWVLANSKELVEIVTQVVGVAAIIASLTPNESDNTVLAFIYNLFNTVGFNFGKASNG